MITTDKIIDIFSIADDFHKEYKLEIQKNAISSPKEVKTKSIWFETKRNLWIRRIVEKMVDNNGDGYQIISCGWARLPMDK